MSQSVQKTAARLYASQAVYQMLVMNAPASDVIADFVENRIGKESDMQGVVAPDGVLFSKIVNGVWDRRVELRGIVQGHLHNKDSLFEAEPILGAILLCGTYEILAHTDVDSPIIISEYVEVAKSFFDLAEPKIVNGVLDSVVKTLRAA